VICFYRDVCPIEGMLVMAVSVIKNVPIELTRTKSFPAVHPAAAIFAPAAIGAPQLSPASGRFRRVNPKMRGLTGYSEDELLGMAFSLLTHSPGWKEDFERFRRIIVCREMSEYIGEQRHTSKHGSVAG
jgi:PAS domain-containing protein